MNPEMMMYMMQQQQAPHNLPSEETTQSPFNAGALAAIKSAKQSLGMDEDERRRAMGLAIAKFFSGMAQPGYGPGIAGTLGAAAANVAPALEAYQGEENRIAGLNAALMKHQADYGMAQQKMRQQMTERLLKQAYMDARQKEIERHHKATENRQDTLLQLKAMTSGMKGRKAQQEEEKERRIEEAINKGETPLEVLEPSARAEFQKNAQKTIRDVPVNQRALKTIQKMRDIFKEHPNIGTSWLHLLDNKGKEEGFRQIIGRKFADKKELAALQKLKKYAADLNLATILGVPGKVGTDLLKQTIRESAPGGKLTKEGFDEIAQSWTDRAHENIGQAKKYQDALKRRILPSVEEETSTATNNLQEMSTEDLLKELQAAEGTR